MKVNARSHHWLILHLLLKRCTYIFALQFVFTENSNPKIWRVLKSDHYLTKLEKEEVTWIKRTEIMGTCRKIHIHDLKSPTSKCLRQQRVRRWPKTQVTRCWTNVNSEKQGVVFKITPCHKFFLRQKLMRPTSILIIPLRHFPNGIRDAWLNILLKDFIRLLINQSNCHTYFYGPR